MFSLLIFFSWILETSEVEHFDSLKYTEVYTRGSLNKEKYFCGWARVLLWMGWFGEDVRKGEEPFRLTLGWRGQSKAASLLNQSQHAAKPAPRSGSLPCITSPWEPTAFGSYWRHMVLLRKELAIYISACKLPLRFRRHTLLCGVFFSFSIKSTLRHSAQTQHWRKELHC